MATIDLNNLIKPKQVKYTKNNPAKVVQIVGPTYKDLHLDLTAASTVGLGLSVNNSNDIIADIDIEAIRNSVRNILTTRPGQKILTPSFGASLERYLFEPITDVMGKIIGNQILNAISSYEPRVNVININVTPDPENNQYSIKVVYEYLDIKSQQVLNIIAQLGGQISV